ncbi:hypothetical protein ADUPG1_000006, partial [Aduncisulcus paluster]
FLLSSSSEKPSASRLGSVSITSASSRKKALGAFQTRNSLATLSVPTDNRAPSAPTSLPGSILGAGTFSPHTIRMRPNLAFSVVPSSVLLILVDGPSTKSVHDSSRGTTSSKSKKAPSRSGSSNSSSGVESLFHTYEKTPFSSCVLCVTQSDLHLERLTTMSSEHSFTFTGDSSGKDIGEVPIRRRISPQSSLLHSPSLSVPPQHRNDTIRSILKAFSIFQKGQLPQAPIAVRNESELISSITKSLELILTERISSNYDPTFAGGGVSYGGSDDFVLFLVFSKLQRGEWFVFFTQELGMWSHFDDTTKMRLISRVDSVAGVLEVRKRLGEMISAVEDGALERWSSLDGEDALVSTDNGCWLCAGLCQLLCDLEKHRRKTKDIIGISADDLEQGEEEGKEDGEDEHKEESSDLEEEHEEERKKKKKSKKGKKTGDKKMNGEDALVSTDNGCWLCAGLCQLLCDLEKHRRKTKDIIGISADDLEQGEEEGKEDGEDEHKEESSDLEEEHEEERKKKKKSKKGKKTGDKKMSVVPFVSSSSSQFSQHVCVPQFPPSMSLLFSDSTLDSHKSQYSIFTGVDSSYVCQWIVNYWYERTKTEFDITALASLCAGVSRCSSNPVIASMARNELDEVLNKEFFSSRAPVVKTELTIPSDSGDLSATSLESPAVVSSLSIPIQEIMNVNELICTVAAGVSKHITLTGELFATLNSHTRLQSIECLSDALRTCLSISLFIGAALFDDVDGLGVEYLAVQCLRMIRHLSACKGGKRKKLEVEADVGPLIDVFLSVFGWRESCVRVVKKMKALCHDNGLDIHRVRTVLYLDHLPKYRYVYSDVDRSSCWVSLTEESQQASVIHRGREQWGDSLKRISKEVGSSCVISQLVLFECVGLLCNVKEKDIQVVAEQLEHRERLRELFLIMRKKNISEKGGMDEDEDDKFAEEETSGEEEYIDCDFSAQITDLDRKEALEALKQFIE